MPRDAKPDVEPYWLDEKLLSRVRRDMLRFSLQHLSDRGLAEDAVQEALAGAIKSAHAFRGQAALKTWVFGILKNKIADCLRHRLQRKEVSLAWPGDGDDGAWDGPPGMAVAGNPAARCPEQAASAVQFWRTLESSVAQLPHKQGQAFALRELADVDYRQICAAMDISAGHLHVLPHRAKANLRVSLRSHWPPHGAHGEAVDGGQVVGRHAVAHTQDQGQAQGRQAVVVHGV